MAIFLRFAVVGAAGFVVDAGTLWIIMRVGCGPLSARAISYLAAATFTWAFNRRWAFRDSSPDLARQWAKFLIANMLGGVVNYATFAALVLSVGSFASMPVLGVAAGSLMGLAVNFVVSRRLVFSAEHRSPAAAANVDKGPARTETSGYERR